ncbi:MAG: hypothetical protein JSV35_00195 [Candidatus Bathyarchaeota archaeon]|nr:MAG: hypothetical protein JSV35_00195 [Candidatus Bathyarchaeota archaeon]
MNVSSYPLSRLYRNSLGLGDLDISSDSPIPVNVTIPAPTRMNTNATILPGGYSGVGNTSIANQTYTDTPQGTNITQHFLNITDEMGANITQPVKEPFLQGIIQEHAHSLGIHITEIDAWMYGTSGACYIIVTANASMQVIECGKIAIGPIDINASLSRAGFTMTKIGFVQQMLRNLTETEGQEYVYNSTWITNFVLPETGFITNDKELLTYPPKNWTVDFGNNTYLYAEISEASTLKNLVLEEEFQITLRNITSTEEDLVEDNFLCYKTFHIEYFSCSQPTNSPQTHATSGTGGISDNWSWSKTINLWEANFSLEWPSTTLNGFTISGITMDVYTHLDLQVYVGWKFKWFRLKWCRAWTKLNAQVIVNVTSCAEIQWSWSKNLFEWSTTYTLWVGVIPVVTDLEFNPAATLSIGTSATGLSATATVGLNATGYLRAGVEWKRDGRWKAIWDTSLSVEQIGPFIDATDNVYITIKPSLQFRLSLLFYKLAGPFVEFEPYVLTSLTYTFSTAEFTWWIDVGVNVNAGIEFSGCIKRILRLSDFSWTLWGKVLWTTREIQSHDVMVTHLYAPQEALVTEPVPISLGVLNKGASAETVTVTVHYLNGSQWEEINATQIDIGPGNWTSYSFDWATDNMTLGDYPLLANASIPNDGSTEDNNTTNSIRFDIQNIAIVNAAATPTTVNAGDDVNINATVMNQGSVNITSIPISAFYDDNLISEIWCEHTRWVFNLQPGAMKNLSFTWHTHGVDEGTYQVNVTAFLLAYETNQTDNYREAGQVTISSPLINHDIAVTQIYSPKTSLGENYSTTINVTIRNEGNEQELLVHVTCCVNSSSVGTTVVAILPASASATVTFTWNATFVSKGNYTLRAFATPVLGEIDTTDNSLTSGWILVTIPGDVDCDKDVDIFDIVAMVGSYGKPPDHDWYKPNADIIEDGKIDIFDIVVAVCNYLESW